MSSPIPRSPLTPQENAWVDAAAEAIRQPNTSSEAIQRLKQEAQTQGFTPAVVSALVARVKDTSSPQLLGIIPESFYQSAEDISEDFESFLRAFLKTKLPLSEIIKDENQRTLIAKFLAEKASQLVLDYFYRFDIVSQSALVEVVTILAEKNPKLTARNFMWIQITSESERIKLMRIIAEKDPASCCICIKRFDVTSELVRIEIAKIVAEKAPRDCVRCFADFKIENMLEKIAIAKIIAEGKPAACAEYFKMFGIVDEIEKIGIAKIIAVKAPKYCARFFEEFEISSEPERVKIAKIVAGKEPGECAQYLRKFGIKSEPARIEIAKIVVEGDAQGFVDFFDRFGILSQIAIIELIKTVIEKEPKVCAENFGRFGISSESTRVEIVKIIAIKDPKACAEFFGNFFVKDEAVRIEIAKIIAEKEPKVCAENFDNFDIFTNQSLRVEIAEIIAQKDPKACAEHFRKFDIHLAARIKLAKIIAEKAPRACAQHFANFNIIDQPITDQSIRIEIATTIAENDPEACAIWFRDIGILSPNGKQKVIGIIAEKKPLLYVRFFGNFDISVDEFLIIIQETASFKSNPNRFLKLDLLPEIKEALFDRYLAFLAENPGFVVSSDVILYLPAEVLSSETLTKVANCLPPLPAMLEQVTKLKERLSGMEFNPANRVVKVIPLPSIAEIDMSLQEIQVRFYRYFNLVNTQDLNHPFYMDPTMIRDGDTIVKKQAIRKHLEQLFTNIATRAQAEAVPKDPEEKEKFYRNLENWLGQICKKLDEKLVMEENGHFTLKQEEGTTSEEQRLLFTEVITQIAIAGSHCGTRWKNVIHRYYKTLYKIEDASPKETLEREIAEFRLAIAELMFPDDIHGFGMFLKRMGQELQIPGYETADETMEGWHESNPELDRQRFFGYFHPYGIVQYLTGRYQGDASFRAFIEEQLRRVVNELDPQAINKIIADYFKEPEVQEEKMQLIKDWKYVLKQREILIPPSSENKFSEGVFIDALPEILADMPLDKSTEDNLEDVRMALEKTCIPKGFTREQATKIQTQIDLFVSSLQDTPFLTGVMKYRNDPIAFPGSRRKKEEYQKLAMPLKQERFVISKTIQFLQSCGIALTRQEITSMFQSLRESEDKSTDAIRIQMDKLIRQAAIIEHEPRIRESMQQDPFLLQRAIAAILKSYDMLFSYLSIF